jgi:two-component system LytT family response regulator
MRALIVDDEPLARQRLRTLLAEVGGVECIGEAGDGKQAVADIDGLQPDLVFLDVQMPELTGLQVLDRITHDPLVIFTTAFERYAVAAFELEAVDYLLKPFGRERLERALERVSGARDSEDRSVRDRARSAASGSVPRDRILVRDRGRIVPVAWKVIEHLEAEDDYTRVHVRGKSYLVNLAISDFERVAPAERFVRVHRSHIVNLDHVAHLTPMDGGRFTVEMAGGVKVPVSRGYARRVRELVL